MQKLCKCQKVVTDGRGISFVRVHAYVTRPGFTSGSYTEAGLGTIEDLRQLLNLIVRSYGTGRSFRGGQFREMFSG